MCTFPKNSDSNDVPNQTFEDFLFNSASDDEDNDYYVERYGSNAELVREESNLEREIINIIVSGSGEDLKPNSGQSVTICSHNVCVGFEDEENEEFRAWEWHGHIMIYDRDNGSSLEYIYGTYFQRFIPNSPINAEGN